MSKTLDVFDTSANISAWTDDTDWSLGAPPNAGEDGGTSAYAGTIDYDEVSTIHSWGSLAATLDIQGGSLTLLSNTNFDDVVVIDQGIIDVALGATFSLGSNAGLYQIYNLENSGTVNIGADATLEAGGTIGGVVQGAGTLELTKSTITTSALDVAAIDFFADLVTLDVSLSFDVPFEIATDNNGIALNGNTLTLGGDSIALSGYIDGPGAIDITGTATIESGFRDAEGSGNTLVTLEVSGALNQTGSWSAAGDLTIDASASWGIDDASTLSDGGNLAIVNNGALEDNASGLSSLIDNSFVNNGTITIAAGATLELQAGVSGATAQVGQVQGAGALEIDEDATFNDNTSLPTLEFEGKTSTLGAGFTAYAGAFAFLAQSTVQLSGQTVTLSGGATQLENAGSFEGPGVIKITGSATVGGNANVTGATLEDAGSITQNGELQLGDVTIDNVAYNGKLLIDQGATYTYAAASVGLTTGSAADTIVNNGLIDIKGANNSNLDHLVNNSTITIESTNFQFEGQTNINDDVIDVVSGSLDATAAIAAGTGKTGLIEIAAGAAATFNVGVAGQIVTFEGGSASVTLNSPGSFTGAIAGFSNDGDQIVLSGKTIASVTLSGPNASTGLSTLTAKSSNGQTLASLSLSGNFAGLIPVVVNGDAIELTTQHASDFTGSGYSDVAFEDDNGTVATWLVDGAAQDGGAALGAPGPDWTVVATGDLNGDGVADIVFENSATGNLAVWQMANDAIALGYSISGPGGSWKVVGTGDFNGDGSQGLLLRDDAGDLAIWDVASGGAVTGGEIGNPGAGWTFVGTGDFNGDGVTDLLFENASGQYATWLMDGFKVVGGAALGSPGAGWTYVATGDFTGNGTSDILFENDTTGEYASWDLKDDAISGGGAIGDPGADWVVKGVGNYGGAAASGVLFENVATGVYADWELDDTHIVGGGAIGAPGSSWSVVGAPAAAPELQGTVFFQNSAGEVVTWNVEGGANAGGADFGRAPGYTMLGVGDFTGSLQPDVLFEDGGQYAIWETNGSEVVGGGALGSPGGTWQFAAIGDFDGSGRDGILFQDANGDLATWNLDGTTIVDGGLIGNPGAGWTFKAAADFTGDGTSDLLFENASGEYATWNIAGNSIVGGGVIGSPGAGWTFMGAGDFNGDGKADILFENTTSGEYATWDMSGTAIVGGGAIGNPGSQFQFAGIADVLGDHQDSILFYDAASNSYATWNLSDTSMVGGASLGSPGAGWTEKAFV